jgi:hypothetical protein
VVEDLSGENGSSKGLGRRTEDEHPDWLGFAAVGWKILKAYGEQEGPDVDGRLFLYEIGSEDTEPHRVEVVITGQARSATNPDENVRRAVETDGQSAVEALFPDLAEDVEPPARINVTGRGIGYE